MQKKRKYKRICYADRQIIEVMCNGGFGVTEIADVIGVNRATMYREFERGGVTDCDYSQYSADVAQKSLK